MIKDLTSKHYFIMINVLGFLEKTMTYYVLNFPNFYELNPIFSFLLAINKELFTIIAFFIGLFSSFMIYMTNKKTHKRKIKKLSLTLLRFSFYFYFMVIVWNILNFPFIFI